ncbi:MAG TPA: GNAT family N-acetyltransferase, partial [Fervidobacterium sp.]|nr:GNAT family N-acetyltransferase [Fervidobacterium sp.]
MGWFNFENRDLIDQDMGHSVVNKLIKPSMNEYIGEVFEDVSSEFLERMNTQNRLPFRFKRIGKWWGNNPLKKREEEIDIVAYDEEPIGAARVRFPDDANRAKIERVSVIPKHRGKGVGKDIMIKIDEHLREHGVAEIYLDAQSHVKNFYEKLGYTQVGEEFEEV